MRLTSLAACLLLLAASVRAGTIAGTVHAEPAAEGPGNSDDAYGSRRYKFAERVDYDQLRDFVVYLTGAIPDRPPSPPAQPVLIRQKDVTFVPHVVPIVVGTVVEWPNDDEIFHNVFSISPTKPFDLGLYNNEHPPKRITFDQLGQVDAFCSIHSKMHCIILVLPNNCFSLADEKGRFAIKNVPPGTYQLRAWHERLPALEKTVTVPAQGDVRLDLTLGFKNLPKY